MPKNLQPECITTANLSVMSNSSAALLPSQMPKMNLASARESQILMSTYLKTTTTFLQQIVY